MGWFAARMSKQGGRSYGVQAKMLMVVINGYHISHMMGSESGQYVFVACFIKPIISYSQRYSRVSPVNAGSVCLAKRTTQEHKRRRRGRKEIRYPQLLNCLYLPHLSRALPNQCIPQRCPKTTSFMLALQKANATEQDLEKVEIQQEHGRGIIPTLARDPYVLMCRPSDHYVLVVHYMKVKYNSHVSVTTYPPGALTIPIRSCGHALGVRHKRESCFIEIT